MTAEIQTVNTTPEGLDALADELAAELGINRDALRAKLAEFEDVCWDPEHNVPVRIVRHEVIGDWQRVEIRPFLRLIPDKAP